MGLSRNVDLLSSCDRDNRTDMFFLSRCFYCFWSLRSDLGNGVLYRHPEFYHESGGNHSGAAPATSAMERNVFAIV